MKAQGVRAQRQIVPYFVFSRAIWKHDIAVQPRTLKRYMLNMCIGWGRGALVQGSAREASKGQMKAGEVSSGPKGAREQMSELKGKTQVWFARYGTQNILDSKKQFGALSLEKNVWPAGKHREI